MNAYVSPEADSNPDPNLIKVKLFVANANQSVVHAEVGEEFCNLLFSFLTLPLGHVVKLLGVRSSISCIDNLYRSAEFNLEDCMNSDEIRDMVVSPRLPPFFSCTNPLFPSDEKPPTVSSVACCPPCIRNRSLVHAEMKCDHGTTKLLAVNPKVPTVTTEIGGGYAKGPGKFLVTDGLGIAPFSLINVLNELKAKELSVSNLVTTEVTFTQVKVTRLTTFFSSFMFTRHKSTCVTIVFSQALDLLRAALVSRNALTLACLPTKPKRRPNHR